MEHIVDTLTHNWILGAIAVILIFFIIGALIRMAVKVAAIALIIGVIMVVVVGLTPGEVINKGKSALEGTTDIYKTTLQPLIEKEVGKANYSEKPNGDYTITASDLKITGNQKDKEVIIKYKGKDYTINTEDLGNDIKSKIEDFNQ